MPGDGIGQDETSEQTVRREIMGKARVEIYSYSFLKEIDRDINAIIIVWRNKVIYERSKNIEKNKIS